MKESFLKYIKLNFFMGRGLSTDSPFFVGFFCLKKKKFDIDNKMGIVVFEIYIFPPTYVPKLSSACQHLDMVDNENHCLGVL